MKKIAFAVIASLAFSTTAMAQPAPSGVDQATVKAVNELLVSMKYHEVLRATMTVMAEQMPVNMLAGATTAINNNRELTAEQKATELDKLKREMPKFAAAMMSLMTDPAMIDEMIVEMGPLYARHFTLDEIRQLTAFYHSPIGAKTLKTMPALMNEGMQLGQKVMIPRVEKLMRQMQGK